MTAEAPMTLLFLGVVALCLAMVSAVVSALETALASLDADGRRRLCEGHPGTAAMLDRIESNPGRIESALMLANVLADLPLIVLCLLLLDGLPMAREWSDFLVGAVVFASIIFWCEIAPKTAALANPAGVIRFGLPAVRLVHMLLGPVCSVMERVSEGVADLVTKSGRASNTLSDEELHTLILVAHEEGDLLRGETRIIEEILNLSRQSAKHCMTPRVDVFAVPDDLTNEEVSAVLRDRRYRRVPVVGETPDDLLGILDVRSFLMNPDVPYLEQLTPPSFVPETMNALELLRGFLSHRRQLAILVDEFGGIEGIVTLSDLTEELLADVAPQAETELYIEKLTGGRILASGSARLDDLSSLVGFPWEADGIETVGGFVVNHMGHLPKPGTRMPFQGWEITIRRATRKRIREVLLEPVNGGQSA